MEVLMIIAVISSLVIFPIAAKFTEYNLPLTIALSAGGSVVCLVLSMGHMGILAFVIVFGLIIKMGK